MSASKLSFEKESSISCDTLTIRGRPFFNWPCSNKSEALVIAFSTLSATASRVPSPVGADEQMAGIIKDIKAKKLIRHILFLFTIFFTSFFR